MDKTTNNLIVVACSVILAPVVAGIGLKIIGGTIGTVGGIIDRMNYKKTIKQGLKEGSIVEVDGKYYTIEVSDD